MICSDSRVTGFYPAGDGRRGADGVIRGIFHSQRGPVLTCLAVLVAAIFFRAPSCGTAIDLLGGMLGFRGAGTLPSAGGIAWIVALYVIIWGLPNTQQLMASYEPALEKIQEGPLPWLRWQMSIPWAITAGIGAIVGLAAINNAAEFLYFQF